MGALVLVAEESIAATPMEVYSLFGASAGAGWVFDAECDRLTVGAVVTLLLPLADGHPVQILGRITKLVPGQRIVISHDQPWRGRLRVAFAASAPGTTVVTLSAELDDEGLDWLLRRRGWPAAPLSTERVHPIGLLTSKSGPGAVFAVACENVASMAIDELNADGGLGGRPVRLLVGDDATDPAIGASEARRLVAAGCRVVLASVTSATFGSVERALANSEVPLVHTVLNEGGTGAGNVFRLGERPANQLATAAIPLMRETQARHWFLIGDDYSWSHGAHRAAMRFLPDARGVVVGERYVPLGTKDFGGVIEHIKRSGADLVLSSLVGADEVAFERQSYELGLRARCRTLSLVLDESTRERIGDAAATGLWATFGYFQQLPTATNEAFLRRYKQLFGRWAPPVSTVSESVYEAVHLYAAAVRHAKDDDPRQVAAQLRQLRAQVPRGEVTMAGPHVIRQELHLAEAVAGGYRLLDSRDAVDH